MQHGHDDFERRFLQLLIQRITVQHMLYKFGVHPHRLRHTFCRELVSTPGVDIATVAELAGHADNNITRRYAKPTEAEIIKAVDQAFT
ncbi:tyrosine-type recombinase/integrase [Paenibacillus macerans]|uniref:Tyrosine-type recombinase/integrase n=1 Tax=Paenibacillus macerans TaxID=44252 RepID=A0A6N8ERI5_PAEMA|nr:site-specific integrase [Paenibacillus macerans]MEC0330582.1 site-specific integrase [Paenibacillus macerans]MED4953473.1 site-specific integrase [Paenibacillus macerans]MUG20838.1 tyrosine-type recombinase/integrase [Paenibacillus macerans]